jgi:hypothetical protein
MRLLAVHLVDHRVLTTHHIVDLLYTTRRGPSIRWAQRRLATLRGYGILDRFRPRTATGSAPYHWILDSLGAEIATYQKGLPKNEAAALVHARSLVGSYITSLEMAGCSVTLLRVDDDLVRLWDAPVKTPALRWGA